MTYSMSYVHEVPVAEAARRHFPDFVREILYFMLDVIEINLSTFWAISLEWQRDPIIWYNFPCTLKVGLNEELPGLVSNSILPGIPRDAIVRALL